MHRPTEGNNTGHYRRYERWYQECNYLGCTPTPGKQNSGYRDVALGCVILILGTGDHLLSSALIALPSAACTNYRISPLGKLVAELVDKIGRNICNIASLNRDYAQITGTWVPWYLQQRS